MGLCLSSPQLLAASLGLSFGTDAWTPCRMLLQHPLGGCTHWYTSLCANPSHRARAEDQPGETPKPNPNRTRRFHPDIPQNKGPISAGMR